MLVTTPDENLTLMGIAREVVNKIQRQRKTAGLHIDDPVEIFYERHAHGHPNDTLKKVLE